MWLRRSAVSDVLGRFTTVADGGTVSNDAQRQALLTSAGPTNVSTVADADQAFQEQPSDGSV